MALQVERVFVYGSLRRGGEFHRLLQGGRYLGLWRTSPTYNMVDFHGYPGVYEGGRRAISGEIYLISRRILKNLDRLEEYPRLYDRKQIVTRYGLAWVYLLATPDPCSRQVHLKRS